MSVSDAESTASTAARLIDEAGGWQAFIQDNILGAIVLQLLAQVLDGINSFGDVLLGPPRALGVGLTELVGALFDGFIGVFDAGTQATIRSFTDGVLAFLGPLAQPTAVGTILLSFAVFLWGVNRLDISPLSFVRSIRG